MKPSKPTATEVDALLPQTQCGLCDYDGCKPYADAIANGKADFNCCPPGGVRVLNDLANLFEKPVEPYLAQMQIEQKPTQAVFIQEDLCIGCKKCIKACPVDAIVGSKKLMHTVIESACNGCELCIPVCPMDCIHIKTLPEANDKQQIEKSKRNRKRFNKRNTRLEKIDKKINKKHDNLKLKTDDRTQTIDARKLAIQAAIDRVKHKRDQS